MEHNKPPSNDAVPGNEFTTGLIFSKLVSSLNEQNETRARELKWQKLRYVFLAAIFGLGPTLYLLTAYFLIGSSSISGDYAAMVRINGGIAPGGKVSADKIVPALNKAFEDEESKGVVLLVNSPGGTVVQSALIHDHILNLRKKHPDTKVVVVSEDSNTSGAYFISSAAPTIYANRSSIVGSIGVIMDMMALNLDSYMKPQFGLEHRVMTAGKFKNMLDRFGPVVPEQQDKVKSLLAEMHTHFKSAIIESRGDKLKGSPEELFTGEFWTGQKALELGLIDGLSDLPTVLETEFNVKQFKTFDPPSSILARLQESYGAITDVVDFVSGSGTRVEFR